MKTLDMTQGSPTKKILLFSLPILLGNIFQQIYSLSDTLVVGRYLGKEALAAVGASSAIVVLITSILLGLSMGSSVLFAKYYAMKELDALAKSISTAFILIVGIALGLTLITSIFINPILQLFQIPDSAFDYARNYLLIVLSGLFFLAIYQVSTAVLRAFGDSKTPLYYLIVSTSINVVFDFVFVIYTPLGVKGPALYTFLAHFLTSIPILIHLYKRIKHLPIKFRVDKVMLKEVSSLSILTSVQQSIMNFGILMVQGLVNSFGVVAIAAFTIGVRIDAFAYMPAQDFANGFSIYVSQNLGVKRYDRIQKGFRSAILTSTLFCGVITLFILVFSKPLIGLFTIDNAVIELGKTYLRIEGLFYILIGYLFIFYALFRGLAQVKISIILTIISLLTRVVLAYSFVYFGLGVESIFFSIPIGWFLADIVGFYLYRKHMTQFSF
ncbi:MATE family efflux transporter [Acholeplasma vituli]|uniref:Probable multidrug resistance protein NorM n=1 Tax=Paracholeplasma vituli TaxID=69473 RepID=A0ABT2PX41_9MOLU|nr:MATE family efflux transporter [Paracholeplasma vituli]MCU0105524.1 MATE family efflux transporter [Paracholeplasma vituli]